MSGKYQLIVARIDITPATALAITSLYYAEKATFASIRKAGISMLADKSRERTIA